MKLEILTQRYHQTLQNVSSQELVTYQNLSRSQKPDVMIISCCDSRISINSLFGNTIGEFFQFKSIANIVPDFQQKCPNIGAALEYAVNFLHVSNIVVMGHSNCGGIKALCEKKLHSDFINTWINTAREHLTIKAEDSMDQVSKNNVLQSLTNLQTYPWIVNKLNLTLKLYGWFFCVDERKIYKYNQANNQWQFL